MKYQQGVQFSEGMIVLRQDPTNWERKGGKLQEEWQGPHVIERKGERPVLELQELVPVMDALTMAKMYSPIGTPETCSWHKTPPGGGDGWVCSVIWMWLCYSILHRSRSTCLFTATLWVKMYSHLFSEVHIAPKVVSCHKSFWHISLYQEDQSPCCICNKRSSAKATAGAMSPFDLPKAHMIWLLGKLFPSNHKCNKVIIHKLDVLDVAMDILLKLNCKLL